MQPELTLIVAATRQMGIGFQGGLPWKGLRKEMQYFARVTQRVPSQSPTDSQNAVIMGRKTWDSIPTSFRPLKNRLNIIITHSAPPTPPPSGGQEVRVPSIEAAIQYAQQRSAARIFVIGGATIYDAALRSPAAKRVLLTSIEEDFECDTFFPLDLTGGKAVGWEKKSREELNEWTGESVAEGGRRRRAYGMSSRCGRGLSDFENSV
ncbi:Dihydrofolate reductase [Cladobotryum mycophilum]|uniref:Dihydrofolate reductase n=1 Tax=Cladobotryum mycophilum TaxID=491253 RepID=A0ABR0SCZ6_9HYPO